jgi:hypothetical protein
MEKQTEEFKIEKNINLPKLRGRQTRYPVDRMEIGDSFSFKPSDWTSVSSVVAYRKRKYGKAFSVSMRQLRCWRTK